MKKLTNMGKTSKYNLREDETLAEVVKSINVCMIKVFPIQRKRPV